MEKRIKETMTKKKVLIAYGDSGIIGTTKKNLDFTGVSLA